MHWLARALAAGPAKAGKRACALLSIVLALAQVLAFVHEGTVGHAVCAEHGEAVHTDRSPRAAELPFSGLASTAVGDSADAADHAHEHCICMAQRRERFVLVLAAIALLEPTAQPVPPVAASGDFFAVGVATVLVAPKGSPPV